MPSQRSINALRFIAENGGRVRLSRLRNIPDFEPRIVGALCGGETSNCHLEGDEIIIDERGYENLRRSGVSTTEPTPEPEPDDSDNESPDLGSLFEDDDESEPESNEPEPEELLQNDEENGVVNIIDILIDRRDYVSIYCKVSKSFSNWMKTNGRVRNVSETLGSGFARNWDCDNNTKFIDVQLGDMERNGRSEYIITERGINPFVIKLASAQPDRKWSVKYKGLVSAESLQQYGEQLKNDGNRFYLNFIKPVKIRVTLSVIE